jgi:hypothetical protein
METKGELELKQLRQFVQNISNLLAHGDRFNDGSEVVWVEGYADAQLWDVIYSARLLDQSGTDDPRISAFHTPTRRSNDHELCVRTLPKNISQR